MEREEGAKRSRFGGGDNEVTAVSNNIIFMLNNHTDSRVLEGALLTAQKMTPMEETLLAGQLLSSYRAGGAYIDNKMWKQIFHKRLSLSEPLNTAAYLYSFLARCFSMVLESDANFMLERPVNARGVYGKQVVSFIIHSNAWNLILTTDVLSMELVAEVARTRAAAVPLERWNEPLTKFDGTHYSFIWKLQLIRPPDEPILYGLHKSIERVCYMLFQIGFRVIFRGVQPRTNVYQFESTQHQATRGEDN